MDIFRKILSPLKYLKINHPQKRLIDFFAPYVFSGFVGAVYSVLPKEVALLGEHGVLQSLSGFLFFVSGFYVAALAAIATFPNENMDVFTDGVPLKLNGKEITRRQFLSYLFGYLALVGFSLVFLSFFIKVLEVNLIFVSSWFSLQYLFVFRLIFVVLYSFVLCNIVLVTLYGLYYLTEKIHESKPKFTGRVGDAPDDDA